MARETLHRKLAEEFGGQCGASLLESLPRIAEAMNAKKASASFTVTGQFTKKRGKITLEMKPRERIPLAAKKFDVGLHTQSGQLQLFGESAEEADVDSGEDDERGDDAEEESGEE
jgi:hypothetical protein